MLYIGIDLGTSACKLLLVDEQGTVLREVSREYPLDFPKPGWSEQHPEHWWQAVCTGIPELLQGFNPAQVAGIGAGGQMHGLVALDEQDQVIRPAILWNDGRTAAEVEYLNQTIGKETLSRCTANIAFAGFTAPKLLWMQRNEPELYGKIRKIMLPKDYVNYRLTGVHCTDYSDASGTLLLDVEHKCWSREICEICKVDMAWLPRLYESWQPVGALLPDVAEALGLPQSTVVCAGAGDNAAAAIGTGAVGEGGCNLSLGTSGTIFVTSRRFGVDPNNALHAFAHADGGWHLMGCMLSAASCNRWWCEEILGTKDYAGKQADIGEEKLGRNPVFFLPYLMGERSPINDVTARGSFVGMTMDCSRADMTQSVLEGVAFAIRDSFEVAKSLGLTITRSTLCGGGSKSPLWRKILANVLNIPLELPQTEQGPGFGGAILAMVACGAYSNVEEACGKLVRLGGKVQPQPELAARYQERYKKFQELYPALKGVFEHLSK